MAKKSLQELAAEMRRQLVEMSGYRELVLGRGLEIVLSRAGQQWCLSLKRPDVQPSETEIRICREAFGVAEGTAERVFARNLLLPKTKGLTLYRGVALQWREVEAVDAGGRTRTATQTSTDGQGCGG